MPDRGTTTVAGCVLMGKYGIGNVNDNGKRLCNFCEENNMAIGGTQFQHKDIHKRIGAPYKMSWPAGELMLPVITTC